MAFTKDDLNTAIQELGNCEDDVTRRTLLVALSDNLNGVFDENQTLTENLETANTDLKKAQDANTELFLRLGEKREPESSKIEKPETKRRSFEDLFDEKGNIK